MCTLFVHDCFYAPVAQPIVCIDRVENTGPRGVTIRVKYQDEWYTVYAHINIHGVRVLPRNERLYRQLVYAISLIHHVPVEINLETLQKELGERGIFCTLLSLDILRKWRRCTKG
jgi:hypothetical protein